MERKGATFAQTIIGSRRALITNSPVREPIAGAVRQKSMPSVAVIIDYLNDYLMRPKGSLCVCFVAFVATKGTRK